MTIRIPFSGDCETTAPLRRCVEHAADKMGVGEYHVAMLMSHFFEAVANEVAMNRLVRIAGFGAFGPMSFIPRKPGLPPYCYPAFSAARPFRADVSDRCPPCGAAMDAIRKHRRHHHLASKPERLDDRTLVAMHEFRLRLRAQARREGMEFECGEPG